MLETVAMAFFALWVIGLVTGNSLAGAIHVLLLAGLVALYFHRRAVSNARSKALIGSSRALANAMGAAAPARKFAAPAKAGSGSTSRSSAAA
jgi:hypothetical protein